MNSKLKTIWFLAFRSVFRNKRRTILTSFAIATGLFITIFFMFFIDGYIDKLIRDVVHMDAGHIVIQHKNYADDPSIDWTVDANKKLVENILASDKVKDVNLFLKGQGLIRTGYNSVGVQIKGINSEYEKSYTKIPKEIKKGSYLDNEDKNKVVISEKLAKMLKVKVKKKTVLSANNNEGITNEDLLRVKGIFNTGSRIDDYSIHIPIIYAREFYNLNENATTRIGVLLHDIKDREEILSYVRKIVKDKNAVVITWEQAMPDVVSYINMERGGVLVYMGFLVFLVLFTILNTVLMSIFEREKEFSTLLSIGTSYKLLKLQIVFEGIIISAIGCAIGTFAGYILYRITYVTGIDFTKLYGEQADVVGYTVDMNISPMWHTETMAWVVGITFSASVLMSILPMRRINSIKLTRRG